MSSYNYSTFHLACSIVRKVELRLRPSKEIYRRSLLFYLILLSVSLRLAIVLNGGVSLFNSGQDAPTYTDAAFDFSQFGFFSDQIRSLPVWPAGYPFFLSIFLLIFGDYWWMFVVLFQHGFYLFSVQQFLSQFARYQKKTEHIILSILLLFLPSLIYSSSENMYESLICSSLLLGVSATIRLSESPAKHFPWVPFLTAIAALGFAIFIQPKTAPVGIIILVVGMFTKWRKYLLLTPLVLWGMILTIIRSVVAYGIYSPSTNYSIAIQVSGLKIDCPISEVSNLTAVQLAASKDQQYILCSLQHFVTHPLDLFQHAVSQGRALFGPMNGGGVPGASTWFHGLDFMRVADALGFYNISFLIDLENVYSLVLNLCIFSGFLMMLRRLSLDKTLILTAPIVLISVVHLISDGDARYRLPFLPFQMIALSFLLGPILITIIRRLNLKLFT